MAAGFVGDGVAEAVGFGHPAFGAEEDFALILVFGNEDAVEADVIDDDAVGEILDLEGDEFVVAIATNFEHGGDGAAGSDGDFRGGRFQRDVERRGIGEGDFAE